MYPKLSTPKSSRRVSRACEECARGKTACEDQRPCNRCIQRGIGSRCHDREGLALTPSPKEPTPGRKRVKRSSAACLPCFLSKTRCIGERPCHRCIKRGRTHECVERDAKRSTPKRRHKSHDIQFDFGERSPPIQAYAIPPVVSSFMQMHAFQSGLEPDLTSMLHVEGLPLHFSDGPLLLYPRDMCKFELFSAAREVLQFSHEGAVESVSFTEKITGISQLDCSSMFGHFCTRTEDRGLMSWQIQFQKFILSSIPLKVPHSTPSSSAFRKCLDSPIQWTASPTKLEGDIGLLVSLRNGRLHLSVSTSTTFSAVSGLSIDELLSICENCKSPISRLIQSIAWMCVFEESMGFVKKTVTVPLSIPDIPASMARVETLSSSEIACIACLLKFR